MKRLEEMSNPELVELTDDQIIRLVKSECAHDGVALPIAPEPFEALAIKKTESYYQIEGTSLKSRSEKLLQAVLDLLLDNHAELLEVTYDYNIGYGFDYIKGCDNTHYKIEKNQCYRYEDLTTKSDWIQRQKQLKEKHDKEKKAYDDAFKRFNQVRASVFDAIYTAKNHERLVAKLKEQFAEYRELADGDVDQAEVFFAKAHSDMSEELLAEVLGKGWKDKPAPAAEQKAVH